MYIADQIQKQFNDHTAYIRIYLINLAVWIAFYNLGYLVIYSLGIIFLLNFWMIRPYGHTRRFLFANSMAFVFFLLLMTVLQAITPLRLCDCDFERINSCFTDDMSPLDIYKNLFCNDISATDIFGTLLVAYSGFVHAFFGLSGIRFKSNAS